MATTAPLTATVQHAVTPAVATTPNPADILDTEQNHRRHAIAVTEQHGLQVVEIEDPDERTHPTRAVGTRTVSDLPSFLAELDRRPVNDESTLWGNADRGQITAIYNDHDGETAGWRDDQLTLKLAMDPDWVQWHTISGKPFKQEQFGDVVEELLHTVVDPDQAELLEVIDSVRATSRGVFESAITRADGAQKLTYNTEIDTKAGRTGQLEVPQTVTLRLRPWDGHPTTYDVDAYFRLRIDQGTLFLSIKLKPTRQIVRNSWDEITTAITEAVGKPVYAQP